ncbi:TolA-binding protein [Novosphingobium sp. SG751A]|uniref:tetratricopeptide repeat protein n=1 Tax=Novosphingobium sp. SG751A TaxID=2587000 RepID=UPI0020A69E9C|nr:hypothetical protein [Novosphingobium sp. SG751A]NOW46155.1 TolA-binding protein [Novosphingobium sp. SG751A]
MMYKQRIRLAGVALAALLWTGSAIPAQAQEGTAGEIRMRKLEAEVRALQRQVFPGGDTKLFGQQAPNPAPGAAPAAAAEAPAAPPANTALTDILARLSAVESQNARLTAQVEELTNHVHQLEGARPAANAPVEQGAAVAAPEPAPPAVAEPAPAPRPVVKPAPAPAPVAAPVVKPAPAPASRVTAVKAITKPSTGDAGEDEYSYGYKLWEAKFFPEAQQQLKLYLDQYPKHKRVSYARNLLGRAYLDDGKPRDAAPWFLQNYQSDKKGARASDSLLYLSEAMIELKDINRACIALGEFADGYPADAGGRLKSAYDGIRAKVKCN